MLDGLPSEVGDEGVVRMENAPYVPVTGEWVDVPRTQTLFDDVFMHRSGIPDAWAVWPDLSTIGIPNYYSWGYLALTQAAVQAEEPELIDKYQARAEAWADLGTVGAAASP